MVKIDVVTIPESREDSDVTEKYLTVLDEKNKAVAKRFGMEEEDVTLQFYDSKGALVGSLGPNQTGYGIYSGYIDTSNEIKVLHPNAAEGLLNDIPKEIGILIDFALTKLYLCKKYYPKEQDFKLYHKYLADAIGRISAGNYYEKSHKFDIKMWFNGIKYKKDQELGVALYLMLKGSGLDFIYENLDTIMKDLKISKSIETIYNKPMSELIKPVKDKILEEERVAQELEKKKRAAQRDAMISERKERELKYAQNNRTPNGADGARRVHISSRNFSNQNNNNNNNNNSNNRNLNNSNNSNNSSNSINSNSKNNRVSSYSNSNNRTYKNVNNNTQSVSNKDKANFNNPNNPNYKGNKTDTSNSTSTEKKKKLEDTPNGYNTDRNNPQKFATPIVN